MQRKHQEVNDELETLQQAKRKETAVLKQTIDTLKRIYKQQANPDNEEGGKFQKVIECLEQQILILREAKTDYTS